MCVFIIVGLSLAVTKNDALKLFYGTIKFFQAKPGKSCVNCGVEFIPYFNDTEGKGPVLPEVNLNIIPLGAILTFIFIVCCKCFSWALEDVREWDDKHVQVPQN